MARVKLDTLALLDPKVASLVRRRLEGEIVPSFDAQPCIIGHGKHRRVVMARPCGTCTHDRREHNFGKTGKACGVAHCACTKYQAGPLVYRVALPIDLPKV